MKLALEYHGTVLKWPPTKILCLNSGGPLEESEPKDADIINLVFAGYAVFVELQPGDETRYGLLLTAGIRKDGSGILNVSHIGGDKSTPITVSLDKEVTLSDCESLAKNEWTQMVFAWWLNCLRSLYL